MWLDIQVANEMAKERIEIGVRNAQREAQLLGYVDRPVNRFNVAAAFSKLFQGRKSTPAIAPEANAQRQTA